MFKVDRPKRPRKESDSWATPKQFYSALNREFNFTFDPCPLNPDFDGLEVNWEGRIYINPPYSFIDPWIEKGLVEMYKRNAELLVYLLPVRTDTKYSTI